MFMLSSAKCMRAPVFNQPRNSARNPVTINPSNPTRTTNEEPNERQSLSTTTAGPTEGETTGTPICESPNDFYDLIKKTCKARCPPPKTDLVWYL